MSTVVTNLLATLSGFDDENLHLLTSKEEVCAPATSHLGRRDQSGEYAAIEPAKVVSSHPLLTTGAYESACKTLKP